jgi:hypothetical protein
MARYARPTVALHILLLAVTSACTPETDSATEADPAAESEAAVAQESPADGFDIHVMAPHVVNGEVMGPYHHYCKVISPEPIIQCILFDSVVTDAPMTEVEYIVAKSLTRELDREQWNVAWHDHAVEIATGRVQVIGMSDEDAQAVVDIVMNTDGLIFHMWPPGSDIPTGDVSIAQAISHVPLDEAEWNAQKAALVQTEE